MAAVAAPIRPVDSARQLLSRASFSCNTAFSVRKHNVKAFELACVPDAIDQHSVDGTTEREHGHCADVAGEL
jgi:hypothetical protein